MGTDQHQLQVSLCKAGHKVFIDTLSQLLLVCLLNLSSCRYYVWNRWGRVGEPGQNAMKGPFKSIENAAKEFTKKFTDKTKNKWEDRRKFVPVPGKYTLIEMDDDSGDEEVMYFELYRL